MKKIIIGILIYILISFKFTKAEEEFEFEEEKLERKVILRESSLSKRFSIFSIRIFLLADKFIINPIAKTYNTLSTKNFQNSVGSTLSNLEAVTVLPTNVAIFSPQRTMSEIGYVLLNSSAGILGTANLAKEFELSETKTEVVDLLRFYGMPEVFFFTLGVIPITLNTSLDIANKNILSKQVNFTSPFVVGFTANLINERSLKSDSFDVLAKLPPELIYDTIKNNTFNNAKYFKLNRTPFKAKSQTLKNHYSEKEFLL